MPLFPFFHAAYRLARGLCVSAVTLCVVSCFLEVPAVAGPADYFVIRVVDQQTGRGVPLVELRTTDDVPYYTDSNGIVAFLEPGLMSRKVFFTVTSPGYEFAADGFGFHGAALETRPGTTATLQIKRLNIAERLCRLTGAGIYRDSLLAGLPAPLRKPTLNADVSGQDSVLGVPYKGALHWFWGDTSRIDYPLGNFGTTGATSPLGADPSRGIDYTYFTGPNGFARPMLPISRQEPVWVAAVSVVDNGSHLIAFYSQIERMPKASARGLALFNDSTKTFEPVARFDASKSLPLDGHPLVAALARTKYLLGTDAGEAPLPCIRVPATLPALKDLNSYEIFTCLKGGSATGGPERDRAGRLVYGWKRDALPLTLARQDALIAAGSLKPEEGLLQIRDLETGQSIRPHTGSVYWNAYRGRWVMVFCQARGGISNLGEIWFAEADTPVGPWLYARKVASHPKMDFYNPTQHPFFDEDNGRRIYFEGTYVNTFSGNPLAVPRYNYNQILYRLTLDDSRLRLPQPVYEMADGSHRMREELQLPKDGSAIRSILFCAVPPARRYTTLIPIYGAGAGFSLDGAGPPLFYALPAGAAGAETMPLKDASGRAIATVWRCRQSILAVDFSLTPAGPDAADSGRPSRAKPGM